MTPAERQLVIALFDRLATLEDAPRDADAERLIRDGLAQAPNAVYALVQTTLVQDEALRQANARIEALEAERNPGREATQPGGFLDTMRNSVFGREPTRGSVPNVRPSDAPMGAPAGFGVGSQPAGAAGYGAGGPMPAASQPQSGRGSFLGTAAAAAAGVIGGSLLLDGIRSMTGHKPGGHGIADSAAAAGRDGGSPWGFSGGDRAGGGSGDDLARQAGIDSIGRDSGPFGQRQPSQGHGLFGDTAGSRNDADPFEQASFDDGDFNTDDAGDFGGDSGFGGDE